ncbi:MAG TPA: urease accessory protein UreE [Devosiaceae bacterium]
MLRVVAHLPAPSRGKPFDTIILEADERRIRRKVLTLQSGDDILLDFPAAVTLGHGDALQLEDGRLVGIEAKAEPLYAVTGRNPSHVIRLAWHLGNRHLPAQLEEKRILIRRDHVIRDMLVGLGATVTDIEAPFSPEHGAYHGHGHGDGGHALLNRK